MANVEIENYSIKVKEGLNDGIISWLYEVGGEIQARAVRNSRVDTGQLRSSWDYEVDEGAKNVTVGSPLENAIWEEFGTGQYALQGNGRKTPWVYKDRQNKWHKTVGKTPNRTLHNAVDPIKNKIAQMLQNKFGG